MVALLFLLTIITFLVIDYLRRVREERKKEGMVPAMVSKGIRKPTVLESEPYYHPTHSWAKITDDLVTIGVDEFAAKLIGRIQRLDVPKVGSYLKQGQVSWRLFHGKRELSQCSPVEGEVVEFNHKLIENPDEINRSPYTNGWIIKIKPYSLRQNLKNLLHGKTARRWLDTVRSQFIVRFSTEVGPVCQDGGELIDDAGELLSEQEWKEVLREFFQVDE